jgi:hypothetical protein
MASFTIHFMVCPHCGKRIKRGIRYFGPAEVKCKQCQEVVPTRLMSWHDLSIVQKIWFSVVEILVPTFYGMRGFDAVLVLFLQITLWGVGMVPFVLIGTIFEKIPALFSFFMFLGFLTYPAILVVRLVRMIQESETYTTRKQIPTWKF